MLIAHITEYCHAGSIGGTERYLLDLIRCLASLGTNSCIGWLSGTTREYFRSEGIPICPLPAPLMRVDEPPVKLVPAVQAMLNENHPDLIHFHTFGLAEAAIARIADQRGIPYVFTYHSPAWTCRREDLLRWGRNEPCDGEVRTLRCAACKVQERLGGPPLGGYFGALCSAPVSWVFAKSRDVNFRRRICFISDTRRYRRALREFLGRCSLVVSCSDWGVPVLVANNARPNCIRTIPQGVPEDFVIAAKQAVEIARLHQRGTPFTIGYIGRITPVKGVGILAKGFFSLKDADLRLRIYGFVEDEKSVDELNSTLIELARQDSRIELLPKLPLAEMLNVYAELDLIAVPSVWPETGPLVLFEGLQMGVPVFGSNRLGHLGLLRAGGKIVQPNTPAGWESALRRAVAEFRIGEWDKRRERLRTDVGLRSMRNVAAEMMVLYNQLMPAQSV